MLSLMGGCGIGQPREPLRLALTTPFQTGNGHNSRSVLESSSLEKGRDVTENDLHVC